MDNPDGEVMNHAVNHMAEALWTFLRQYGEVIPPLTKLELWKGFGLLSSLIGDD